jgi:hypothetical protein
LVESLFKQQLLDKHYFINQIHSSSLQTPKMLTIGDENTNVSEIHQTQDKNKN